MRTQILKFQVFPECVVTRMDNTWALNLFDRLHMGHHILIDRLSEMPNPIAAATDGELVGHDLELVQIIQPIEHRVRKLEEYLIASQLEDQIEVRVLDAFNDLISIDGSTHFIMYVGPCCTEIETKSIEKRTNLGFQDTMEYLKPFQAQDGDKLSSARLRRGDVDRQGRPLRGTSELPRRLELGDRSRLQTPKGDVFNVKEGPPEVRVVQRLNEENPHPVIAVGDVTCDTLSNQGYVPDVSIVDGITKRGKFEGDFSSEIEYQIYNPPAVLYPEAWSVVDTAIYDRKKSLIIVDGEEDLMGFPAVLLAPEGAVMLYGQPDVGIVWVPVTDENKKLAKGFLDDMPTITP
ncbi:MAG: DUF359 domain-containing protein [Candidatus Thorarchaeota archaeon]